MSIAIIYHPDCELHHTGHGHPEQPKRIQVIQDALKETKFSHAVKYYEAPVADYAQLTRVHDKTYVDWIISIAPKQGSIGIDEDTYMSPGTLRAAHLAAGSVVHAVDLVVGGKVNSAFCNVRPPGHHAEYAKAMGFCFFNNVAVGVMHAIDQHKINKIAIIDFDVHHGNGTQNIFQKNKNVMLCSSFEHPQYPGYEAENDNEHIINVPLEAGTKGADFRSKVADAWFDKLNEFAPELIFFSAGFDAHRDDPLAELELVKEDYVWLTNEIANIAKKHAKGRMISVLEGGYNLDVLKECVPAHVKALADTR